MEHPNSNGKESILIIDDEAAIRKLLDITLQSNGYKVIQAATAKAGEIAAATHQPDLIILDLGLPDEDGQVLLKILRGWLTLPIIILSARHSESEIVKALDSGANDYLVKPFRTGELMARIRSALRLSQPNNSEPILTIKNLTIDYTARTVKKNGELVKLTSTEYTLLLLLVKTQALLHWHLKK